MHRAAATVLFLALTSIPLLAGRKHVPPAAFKTAQYVYVQADDGDGNSPRLYSPDRAAISDVEDGLREWSRYSLTTNPSDADLIFVVHKGRTGGMAGGGGMGSPFPRGPIGTGGPMGTGLGTSDDTLRVYMPGVSRRGALLWTGSARGGLDGPDVPLLSELRKSVEDAYPDPPPDPKKKP